MEREETKYTPVSPPPAYTQPETGQISSRFVVESCCCGCDLETGCKIIGWLQVFVGAVTGIASIAMLISVLPNVNKDDATIVLVVGVIGVISSLITLLLGFLLLHGVYKQRTSALYSWMIINICLIVFSVITTITSILSGSYSETGSNLVSICLACYYLIVVNSYYRKLKVQQPIV